MNRAWQITAIHSQRSHWWGAAAAAAFTVAARGAKDAALASSAAARLWSVSPWRFSEAACVCSRLARALVAASCAGDGLAPARCSLRLSRPERGALSLEHEAAGGELLAVGRKRRLGGGQPRGLGLDGRPLLDKRVHAWHDLGYDEQGGHHDQPDHPPPHRDTGNDQRRVEVLNGFGEARHPSDVCDRDTRSQPHQEHPQRPVARLRVGESRQQARSRTRSRPRLRRA